MRRGLPWVIERAGPAIAFHYKGRIRAARSMFRLDAGLATAK